MEQPAVTVTTSLPPQLVLYLQSEAGLYGSGVALLELTSHLVGSRYRPLVALPEEGPLAGALRDRGIAVAVLPFGALRRSFRPDRAAAMLWQNVTGSRALARLIEGRSVALVHTNSSHMISGVIAANRTRRPHVGHLRENVLPPRWLTRGVAQFIWARSDRVITVSRAVAAELLGLSGEHPRLRVIHDGVDLSAFPPGGDPALARARLGWEAGPHVGVVARLTPWKGHETFFEAAAAIAARHAAARFVIIGDADSRRSEAHRAHLMRLAQRLGIAPRVRWTGFVRPVQPLLSALDVVVLPSLRPEPFGLVVIEAMAAERPVVATAHGGPVEILAHGGGVLVPPGDAPAMAAAVLDLLGDDDRRAAIGRAGREQVLFRFSIEAHVAAVTAVYDELLAAKVAVGMDHGVVGHHRLRR